MTEQEINEWREKVVDEAIRHANGVLLEALRARTIRPMRGQAVIREVHAPASAVLWTPTPSNPREMKTHRGVVLALGATPRTPKGHEVPWGFSVGDEVIYHWEHNEKGSTHNWSDGEPACWMYLHEVDGVVTP